MEAGVPQAAAAAAPTASFAEPPLVFLSLQAAQLN